MINIRQATIRDLEEASVKYLPIYSGNSEHLFFGDLKRHHALRWGNTLLGVISCDLIWPGVACIGAVLTHHIYEHPVPLVRSFKKMILSGVKIYGIHRLQMDIRTDYEDGHKLAKALGFEPEGIMKQFGPSKQDYTLYARIF